jgi:8-oxo-dGTP pyrophosphatase MutT (NUDIX family)
MRLFRSEEHVARWSEETGIPVGDVFSLDSLWRLAQLWFADRLSPGWRRRTVEEANALFAEAGLQGTFWKLG